MGPRGAQIGRSGGADRPAQHRAAYREIPHATDISSTSRVLGASARRPESPCNENGTEDCGPVFASRTSNPGADTNGCVRHRLESASPFRI